MKLQKKCISLLLVVVVLTSIFSGCKGRGEDNKPGTSSSSSSSSSSSAPATEGSVASITPNFLEQIAGMKEENEDTVGWLQVPGTTINDVVVCNFESNQFYHRRNFQKEYDFNGIYYADRRSTFGDGSREQLGVNTCIYGHAMTDDEENEKYNILFAPLPDFRYEEMAKDMPYIFFSTEKENLAFEVFAVFIANTDNADIPYNRNDIEQKEFVKMVKEQVLPRSLYDYDVEIKDDDKFITLSTCIYKLPDGTPTHYPDTYYRYAIMGRLVGADEPLKEKASLTVNEDVLIEPDGKLHSK